MSTENTHISEYIIVIKIMYICKKGRKIHKSKIAKFIAVKNKQAFVHNILYEQHTKINPEAYIYYHKYNNEETCFQEFH